MIIFGVDLTVKNLSVLISQSAVSEFVIVFLHLMRVDRWMPGQAKRVNPWGLSKE